jgi:hypothetical protein
LAPCWKIIVSTASTFSIKTGANRHAGEFDCLVKADGSRRRFAFPALENFVLELKDIKKYKWKFSFRISCHGFDRGRSL